MRKKTKAPEFLEEQLLLKFLLGLGVPHSAGEGHLKRQKGQASEVVEKESEVAADVGVHVPLLVARVHEGDQQLTLYRSGLNAFVFSIKKTM